MRIILNIMYNIHHFAPGGHKNAPGAIGAGGGVAMAGALTG